jgi:K+/H+ antiporter YhaU regulatory subunit KhtT
MSLLRGYPPVLLGEGVELFSVPVPHGLAGRPLRDSGIGSRTGLTVVALRHANELKTPLTSDTLLPQGAELLMLGSDEQRTAFADAYGKT